MKLVVVAPGAWLYVDYPDSVNMATFFQRDLQIQAMKEADWQAGRSFSNSAHVLKFHCKRALACLDFDELANSDEFFQSVLVLSSESYSVILL